MANLDRQDAINAWIICFTSFILILLLTYTFCKIRAQSNNRFLLTIAFLFIISNVAAILVILFTRIWWNQYENEETVSRFCFVMEFIMIGVREVGFHLGYWFFSYKYWLSSVQMEWLFRNNSQFQPSKRTKLVSTIFLIGNIFWPVVYCASAGFSLYNQYVVVNLPPDWVLSVYYSSELFMFILLLVSAFYLIDSILRVRRTIREFNLTKHLNSWIMMANMLTFGLFLLSDLLYYISDGISTFYYLSDRA